jgi:hypothetical protein
MMAAWKNAELQKIGDEKAYVAAWMKARAEALVKAGMEPVWRE